MLHVNMHRLTYSSAYVTIFLIDNANVCCNSRTRTKKYEKEAIFFNCAHYIDYFADVSMLVHVV